jgi:hypothetical protein
MMEFPPISIDGSVVSLSARQSNQLLVVSSTGQSHIISSSDSGQHQCDVNTFQDIMSVDEAPIAAAFSSSGSSYTMITSSSRLLTRGEHSDVTSMSLCSCISPHAAEAWVLQDRAVSFEPLFESGTCSLIGLGRGAVVWDDRARSIAWGTAPLPESQNDEGGSGPRVIGAVSVNGPIVVVATYDGFVLSYDVRATAKSPLSVAQIENDTLCCIVAQGQARSVVLGGALGKAYICRATHSPTIEQCISTGSLRSLIRCAASNSHQIFCGHVDGRISASSVMAEIVDAGERSSHAVTSVASLKRFVGHLRGGRSMSEDDARHYADGAGAAVMTVPAICATDEVMWAAFSSIDSETSTIVGVAANSITGMITLV